MRGASRPHLVLRAAAPRFAIPIALIAGLFQAFSIASPWDGQAQWWLQVISLAALAWLLEQQPSRRVAALTAWAFGTAWLAGTWWWLFISMHTYGGLPAPLAALAVLALSAFLALYYAGAGALYAAARNIPWPMRILNFGALWLLAELLRNSLFTGFPWGASGYAHVDGPLAGLAQYTGVYGISMFTALTAMALVHACAKVSWKARAAAAVPVAAAWLIAQAATHCTVSQCHTPAASDPASAGKISVLLLQGNIPQDEKFQGGTGIPVALQWYGETLRDAQDALVVAPETAIPLLPQQLPEGYWEGLQRRFSTGGQAALVGVPLGSLAEGYTNSVIGLKPGAPLYRYDKHHLVPFGEFIPPFFRWFTQMMNIPLGDFNRGTVGQPSFEWSGQRLGANICYEDLFGDELAARFADAANAPTVFVNVSNIGWFGDTVAIDQHLNISRMRSLELGRPMLRATNTGATVIIDHRGRVTQALPRHARGTLQGEVEGRLQITPFAAWASRFGLWPLWFFGLAVAAACLGRAHKLSRPSAPAGPDAQA
ncbi:MAG: apolipoprotein N-acyltransferase [Burkholderiaceae bacterium]